MAERSPENQSTEEKNHKCKVCNIKFPEAYSYIEHLESKEHQKRIMKEKYGEKYLEAKAKLDEKIHNGETATSKEKPKFISVKPRDLLKNADEDSDDEVYTCEVCNKICTGFLSYRIHLKGQKHEKNLKKAKLLKQLHEKDTIPKIAEVKPPEEPSLLDRFLTRTEYASTPIVCKTCNKSCTGPEPFKQHIRSEKHKKMLELQGLLEKRKSEGLPTKEISDASAIFHCELCQKGFTGPLPYQQHMESNAHIKQENNVQQLFKIKDLVIYSEEDSTLQCKECGKVFSGPVPFNNHLTSQKHKNAVKNKSRFKKYAKMQDAKKQGEVSTAEVSYEATKQDDNKSSDSEDEFEMILNT